MRSAKTVGMSLLMLFSIGAVMASTASAAKEPKNLTLSTAKGALAENAAITATSTNLVLTTSAGKIECSEVVSAGTLTNNDAKKDKSSFSTVTFTGKETEKECKSTTSGGAAKVTAERLPWKWDLSSKAKTEVKKAEVAVEFPSTGEKCVYKAKTIRGTFTPGEAGKPEAITNTLEPSALKLGKKVSATTCPETGELAGTFTMTSGGETLESEL